MRLELRGRRLVLTTTNGTRALEAVAGSGEVLVTSLRHGEATARYLARRGRPVRLVCAGTEGRLSLEDLLAAGWVVRHLQRLGVQLQLADTARVAEALAVAWEGRELEALRAAEHGQYLVGLGFAQDLALAAQRDVWPGVIRLEDGWLRPAREPI